MPSYKKVPRRLRIITPFIFFKYADFLNIQNVCLQIYRNNRIREKVAYFLRKIQTLQANNSRILKIQNAKFSGYYVYMNTNIWRDFQICISAPVRQRQKLFLNLCFTLFKKCRVEKRRRKDDVAVLSRILDGSKRFGMLSMTNDLKLVSEHPEKHLNLI